MSGIDTWDLDLTTWWWIVWSAMFFVGEWLGRSDYEQFTHHVWAIRNTRFSLVLFFLYAILGWINWHFLVEGWKLVFK